MWMQIKNTIKQKKIDVYIPKFGTAGLILLLSILVVACGNQAGQTQVSAAGIPAPTVTFVPNQGDGTPTPGIPDYLCGAWAVDTSPNIDAGKPESIYAKFVHTVDSNPTGVAGATATATVSWPDGTVSTAIAQTTADGLAVFSIPLQPSALNGIVLVNVTFTAPGVKDCTTTNRPAFFNAMHGTAASPTAVVTPPPSGGPGVPPPGVPPGTTPTAVPTIPVVPTIPIIPTFPPTGTPTPLP